jgi:hypothetical protein
MSIQEDTIYESSKISDSDLLRENLSDALLDLQRASAIHHWAVKTRIVAFLQLALSGFLLKTAYWYINFVGIVGSLLGLISSFKKKNELVFVVWKIYFDFCWVLKFLPSILFSEF